MTRADAGASGGDLQLRRIERDTLIIGGVLTLAALLWWPSQPGRGAGLAGGLALIAVSYQGIKSGVNAVWTPSAATLPATASDGASTGGRPADPPSALDPTGPAGPADDASTPRSLPRFGFVKFFTRHAILAVSAYVMMARFEFDPMAMLAGVTTPAIAATLECARTLRARSSGSHSRFS